jgi:AcrR family transcriptional regulator
VTDTKAPAREDRRVQRTRAALNSAFHRLILERGYEAISVADVSELADVGRSTFYEHYSSLDDLLTESIEHHFDVLAAASLKPEPEPAMERVLQHFWENRKVAAALLSSGSSRVLQPLLAERFEIALSARWPGRSKVETFRRKLLALQLAAGQLTVIAAWVSGRLPGTAPEIAEAVRRSCHAAASAC